MLCLILLNKSFYCSLPSFLFVSITVFGCPNTFFSYYLSDFFTVLFVLRLTSYTLSHVQFCYGPNTQTSSKRFFHFMNYIYENGQNFTQILFCYECFIKSNFYIYIPMYNFLLYNHNRKTLLI